MEVESHGPQTKPWIAREQIPSDYWEIQFIRNVPIGYVHQQYLPSATNNDELIRLEIENVVWVLRGAERVQQSLTIQSVERLNGRLESLEARFEVAGSSSQLSARLARDQLEVTQTIDGKPNRKTIAWKPHYAGPFAIEQSMRRKPLAEGERRQLAYFDPVLAEVVEVELVGGKPLKTPVLTGELRTLTEVEVLMRRGEQSMRSLLWVDDAGISQKSFSSAMDIRTFRTTEAIARSVQGKGLVDMISLTSVPLKGPVEKADQARKITFRIQSRGSTDPFRQFSNNVNQSKRSIDPRTLEVTVHRIGQDDPMPEGVNHETVPDDSFRQPTVFMPSQDPTVVSLSQKWIDNGLQDRSDYERLAKGVFEGIKKKDFSKGMVTAAEVARQLQGDCTEHAILLGAVARSRGIPSRLACGLVYTESSSGPAMAYHMWTELWIGDRWLPLDATQSAIPMPPTRLKIMETVIEQGNPYSAMLQVLTMIGELDIEVIDVQSE